MNLDMAELYNSHKKEFWLFVLAGIPGILVIGCIIYPEIFWDAFIWRYLWGPVVADARGETIGDVSSGYNIVNTLVYGLVLALALFGIYDLIDHLDVTIDDRFVMSLIPWIVLGGSLRTLEDVGLFEESVAPIFISPIIYMVLGIFAVLTMVLGAYLSKIDRKGDDILRLVVLTPPLILYAVFRLPFSSYLLFQGALLLSVFFILGKIKDIMNERYLFISYGVTLLTISLSYNVYYMLTLHGTNTGELFFIPFLTVLATGILAFAVSLSDRYISHEGYLKNLFLSKLNLMIILAHFFDASATYRGIKFYGYREKHVLPAMAIEWVGDPIVMFLLKLVLILSVVVVLDHLYKEELREYPRLTVLIKFAVITLGLAPGVRNTLRLAMGV